MPLVTWNTAARPATVNPLCDISQWVRRKLYGHPGRQWGPAGYRELRKRVVSVREAWVHSPW